MWRLFAADRNRQNRNEEKRDTLCNDRNSVGAANPEESLDCTPSGGLRDV